MNFFEKQKVDVIGQVGVSLQKILLFFMILSAFTLFNGGLLSFLICLVGFIGAVKRNPRLLATYYSVTIFFIILFFFLSLASMATYNNDVQYDEYSYYSESSSYSSSSVAYASSSASASAAASSSSSQEKPSTPITAPAHPKHIWRGIMRAAGMGPQYNPGPSNSTSSESFSYTDSSDYYYETDDVEWNTMNIFIAIVAIFIYFFMSYLKIKSLVLAYRMRKLIIFAAILPEFFHEDCEAPKQEPEPTPAPVQPSNKCVDDNDDEPSIPAPQQTYFAQPGFMPYAPVPMQYPGAPQMVPPPMMYGQYPVYYSFQAPASPDQSQDKL